MKCLFSAVDQYPFTSASEYVWQQRKCMWDWLKINYSVCVCVCVSDHCFNRFQTTAEPHSRGGGTRYIRLWLASKANYCRCSDFLVFFWQWRQDVNKTSKYFLSLKPGVGKVGKSCKSKLNFESIQPKINISPPLFRPHCKATPPKHTNRQTVLWLLLSSRDMCVSS